MLMYDFIGRSKLRTFIQKMTASLANNTLGHNTTHLQQQGSKHRGIFIDCSNDSQRTDESVNPQAETNWMFFFHVESVDGDPCFI
jgi:hypothetical protein